MNLDPTIGDAFEAFTSAINEYENDSVITSESIETFNSAIQADVNFRDLLMGLPMHHSMDTCLGFVSYVLGQVDGKDRAPYFTIISAYYYELGDKKSAAKFLSDALNINQEYSLAKLLSRVFASGWSPESLASMRNGLDAKVRTTVTEQRGILISELTAGGNAGNA